MKEKNIQPNTILSTNVNILIHKLKEDNDYYLEVCFSYVLCTFCICGAFPVTDTCNIRWEQNTTTLYLTAFRVTYVTLHRR